MIITQHKLLKKGFRHFYRKMRDLNDSKRGAKDLQRSDPTNKGLLFKFSDCLSCGKM